MKASDRAIIFGVVLAALAIGFYLLVLGPKRNTASDLQNQISDLHASISAEQQRASFGEQARKEFPRYYGRLVVLGKAVPQQADTSSMLVQLNSIADRSNVRFSGISLSQGAGTAGTGTSSTSTPAPTSTPPPATAGTSTTPSAPASSGTSTTSSTTASATSGSSASTAATPASTLVPATEASAASLPIGAVVGPAGLPTLPYNLTFKGTFFDISNFIGGVDGLVTPNDGGTQVSSNGRLFTVDGFALNVGLPGSAQKLSANFLVTTYVTPEDQGLTAGASPGGPAAPTSPAVPQAQPASAVVSK